LYGVGVYDAVTFMAVPIVIAAVALLAGAVPAVRAARVDPLVAMRDS
jgi:putative ABC transport system permease protein